MRIAFPGQCMTIKTQTKFLNTKVLTTKVLVNDIELNVIEAGDINNQQKKLVVLLHGFPSYSGSWSRQIDPLVNAGYRVLAPDLRGFNLSESPKKGEDINFEIAADDIAELVKNYQADKIIFIGHDFGGITGWFFAMKYPGLLEKFVAVTAPCPLYLSKILRLRNLFKHTYFFLFQIRGFEKVLTRRATEFINRIYKNDPVNEGAFSKEEINKLIDAFSRKDVPLNCMRYYRSIPLIKDQIKSYDQIINPILILTADHDQYVKSSSMANPGREVAPNAKQICIKNCSHWPMADQTEEFNHLILEFLHS